MNLSIILASLAQHVYHLANGAVRALGPLDDAHHHLVAGLAASKFVERDKNVGGKKLAVGCQVGEIFSYVKCANEHLLLALHNLYNLGLGLKTTAGGANVYHHLVAVEGMHRVALGHHDGCAIVTFQYHAVLAVAAAHKDTCRNIIALGGAKLAGSYLIDKPVDRELLQYLNNESTLLGGLGSHLSAHLLVVEGCLILSVEEVNNLVVKLSAFYVKRI